MKKVLESKRLYLREVTSEDLPFLIDLHQDRKVMRYIGPPRSAAKVKERLTRIIPYYRAYPGYGIWMACRKEDDEKIGWACLKDLDGTKKIEIGYRLASAHWRLGYATELALALVEYGFDKLQLSKISGVSNPANIGSVTVLRRAGLTFRKKACYYGSVVDYFSLTRQTWLRQVR